MKINRKITPYNFSNRNTNPKYIVIHYVGSQSTAKNNADYFANAYRGSSAHAFVDENEIWQVVEWNDSAWAVGDSGRGTMKNIIKNSNCISIEMCVKGSSKSGWRYEERTIDNTAWLVQELMKKYQIPASKVYRHYDVTGKNCPANYINNSAWSKLKERLVTPMSNNEPKNNNGLYYRGHVQNVGDQAKVHDGMTMGTEGKGLRLESFYLDFRTLEKKYGDLTVNIKTHIQGLGWVSQNGIKHDTLIGTRGQGKRIEAVEIKVIGLPTNVKLKYQLHISGFGWTPIVGNGTSIGTVGLGRAIEAMKIWVE